MARLDSIAVRHAGWGAATEDEMAAGAAELQQVADGRADLLAETAGLALSTSERKGAEYAAQAQAIAELCRLAGADESLTRSGPRRAGAGPRRGACPRSASLVVRHRAPERQPAQDALEPQTWQYPPYPVPLLRRAALLDGSRKANTVRPAVCLDGSRLHDLHTEIWMHRALPPKSALAPMKTRSSADAVLIHHWGVTERDAVSAGSWPERHPTEPGHQLAGLPHIRP